MILEYDEQRETYCVRYKIDDEHERAQYMDLRQFLRFVGETRTIQYEGMEKSQRLKIQRLVVKHVWNEFGKGDTDLEHIMKEEGL